MHQPISHSYLNSMFSIYPLIWRILNYVFLIYKVKNLLHLFVGDITKIESIFFLSFNILANSLISRMSQWCNYSSISRKVKFIILFFFHSIYSHLFVLGQNISIDFDETTTNYASFTLTQKTSSNDNIIYCRFFFFYNIIWHILCSY